MDDRSEQRGKTAREHDDSELIDNIEPAPSQQGRSGGNLQKDIATQASLQRVRDPDAHEGVDKQDKINHGQKSMERREGDKTA